MTTALQELDDGPSDNFLAATQTVLAWRRTALQVGLGAVVAARLVSEQVGPWVFVAALVGVGVAVAVHASASAAYADAVKKRGWHVNKRGKRRIGDPRVRLAVMTAFTVVVALAAAAWIATSG